MIGYPGYFISEDGDVYSDKRKTVLKKIFNYFSPYERHSLYTFGTKKIRYIHRLVAFYFVPNVKNLSEVNHKDGNKRNNHFSNLMWCTRSENIQHSYDVLNRARIGKNGNLGMLGRKHSDETKFKMSERKKSFWENKKPISL